MTLSSVFNKDQLRAKNLSLKIYILFTVSLFVARALIFVASHGSIENDSGWYLGVAKNVAHRGIYASYSNLTYQEGVGVHSRFVGGLLVQDENGFSYFPPGVTVGPGYILPQALLLRLFGDGWWQYRLWPLITYAGLLFLLFYFVWTLGGVLSLVLFQIWLWAIPQLTITQSYEAFSEHIALFYVLICFLLWFKAEDAKKKHLFMFLCGMFLSFAVLTKLLFLLTISGLVLIAAWELVSSRKQLKSVLVRWALFTAGFFLPIILFELYRYVAITGRFGLEAWHANNETIALQFITQGSGVRDLAGFNWAFIGEKLKVWPDVGLKDYHISWVLFLISPLLMLGRVEKRQFLLVLIMYSAAVVSLVWFILASPWGWTRHAWHGLLLAMVLMCGGLGVILRDYLKSSKKEALVSLLVLILGVSLVVNFPFMELRPFLDERSIDKWHFTRSYRKLGIMLLLGLPHAAIISFDDQRETVNFFQKKISTEDRIYHDDLFFVSEVATLVDKVFYPIGRYFNNDCRNPDGGESYLIMGPYQHGRWAITTDVYVEEKVAEYCGSVVFSNESYLICSLKKDDKSE